MTEESYGAAQFSISADHPALIGHFPQWPIVPGAVLLDRVCEAATLKLGCPPSALKLDNVKFVQTVAPDLRLNIVLTQAETGLRFQCVDNENRVYVSGGITNAN